MKSAGKGSVARRSRFLLAFGFFFFINPIPLGFDILPDVFGCILVYLGLNQLAYFDGQTERARKYFGYLLVLEAVNLLLSRAFVGSAIGSNRMLAVSAVAIGQAILYILIFRSLFSGISYFAMRNNLDKTLEKCDGCAFLSYLAFFVRIGATVIPELMYIIELESESGNITLEKIDTIEGIMSAKPMIVILLSVLALVAGVAWFISIKGLTALLFTEGKEVLDTRYAEEFTSKPPLVNIKRLRVFCFAMYFALAFATDISFDNNQITPIWAMFGLIAVTSFLAKGVGGLKHSRFVAVLPAIGFFVCNWFRVKYVPYGAIAVNETDLHIVFINCGLAVFAAGSAIVCIRLFLKELNGICRYLLGRDAPNNGAYLWFCLTMALWTAGYVVPYYYGYFSTLRLIFSAVFIYKTAKTLMQINDAYIERVSLYGE